MIQKGSMDYPKFDSVSSKGMHKDCIVLQAAQNIIFKLFIHNDNLGL